MFSAEQLALAHEILDVARRRGQRLATAESCTGGLISACLTEVPGSSDVFDRGLVAYANQAKIDLLGVAPECLARFGAVSEPTARAMAEGGLARSGVDLCVAVTGIAGPSGGSAERPVGLVHFAIAGCDQPTRHAQSYFSGDRQAIRRVTVTHALELLRACL